MMNLTPAEREVLEILREKVSLIDWGMLKIELTIQDKKVKVIQQSIITTKRFDKNMREV